MQRLGIVILAAAALVAPSRADLPPLEHSAVLAAPPADVWRVFTTGDGFKALGVAHAEVDFRIGGVIRTHYDPAGVLGDPNTIENTILAYEPGRMLSIRATRAPADFPHPAALESMWTIVYLDDLGDGRTRVSMRAFGFGEDDDSRGLRDFFDRGNARTLERLRTHFAREDAAARADRAEALSRRLIGTWSFRNVRPDGSVFRGRTEAREILGGKFLVAEGWLGNDESMRQHSHYICGRDAAHGGLRVWNFNEAGDVTEGAAWAEGDEHLVVDWDTLLHTGARQRFRVDYRFGGEDRFALTVSRPDGEAWAKFVEVTYERE